MGLELVDGSGINEEKELVCLVVAFWDNQEHYDDVMAKAKELFSGYDTSDLQIRMVVRDSATKLIEMLDEERERTSPKNDT